jgi:hypothetical protein
MLGGERISGRGRRVGGRSVPRPGLCTGLSVDLTTTPGDVCDFSCIWRAFAPAAFCVVSAGDENTRAAGARQDSQSKLLGAVPIGNRASTSPCVEQRYW